MNPVVESGGQDVSAAGARRALLVILLLGVAVRLVLWFGLRDTGIHIHDEKDYNALAVNLSQHGEFAFQQGDLCSIRPPLFPALVAGVYRVFGLENFAVVRLLQAALSLVTAGLVYCLGREVASRRVGLFAAAFTAFYPTLLGFNSLILTEVLFTYFLTASVLALVLIYTRNSLGFALLAGALLGLSALTRSVVWLAPPFVALYLLLTWQVGWGRRLLGAAAVVVAFALVISPWVIRNSRMHQTFVVIDVMGGRNLMMGNYVHTPLYRSWDAISMTGERSWIAELRRNDPWEGPITQGQLDKRAMREGVRFMRANPGLTAQRCLVKFFDFWGLERELVAGASSGYFGERASGLIIPLSGVIFTSYMVLLFLGIFGAIVTPPDDGRFHWLFLTVIVFICALHTIVFGHSRYHLPLMPIVFLYSALALLQLPTLWRQRTWRVRLAALACVILVAGWGWNLVAGDWERFQGILH